MQIDKILTKVQKPGRYVGGELNQVYKSNTKGMAKFAFCFPDTYEIGMSHMGTKIIYHLLNERDDCVCERVFTPWVDMESEMRNAGIPLFSMESQTPVGEFDIVGFTLQYELTYTNVLNMLDLANIPLRSSERGEEHPLVCVGGPCAYNCEPIADFIDFAVLGEAEEVICEVVEAFNCNKQNGGNRLQFLEEIAKIEGIYVPRFYDVTYNNDGTVKEITPNNPNAPETVKKRFIEDLDSAYMPEKVIVPFIEIVHDRNMLELFRGCFRGCRFCQAGYIYRPVRERSVERLVGCAEKLIENTGYEEISLASLSTSDYSGLEELTDKLIDLTERKKVSLSLPSLRVDNFSIELMQKVQKVRKSGLTFAPEAGTQRMRDVINKNVTEENLLNTAQTAFSGGYGSIKLYFMLGLPTETDEDVEGIARLAKLTLDEFYKVPKEKRNRNVRITVSTSMFVPKPFTPFQWEAQDSMEQLGQKQRQLKDLLKIKNIVYNYHQSGQSALEAAFARGDRRLSSVILAALKLGCRFDGWSEHFRFDLWQQAFEECGVDMDFYARRVREFDEVLPWEHIDIGISRELLIKEAKRARGAI